MENVGPKNRRPVIIVSFDDAYAERFVKAVQDICPIVHVSPVLRTLQNSIESMQPLVAIFDMQTTKTEDLSIFDIMRSMNEAFPHVRKIAVGHQNMPVQVLYAMKAGACDFIDRGASLQECRDTISHHLRHSQAARGVRVGHVVGLLSGRENDGESEIAANLATYLSTTPGIGDVLLLDLNLERSNLEIEFDVEVTYSVRDAINELLRLDHSMLIKVLARHSSGVYLLPLTTNSRHDGEISPQELATLLGTLRNSFSYVVINAGCLRNKFCQPYLLPLIDQVMVVCPQLIGVVREVRSILPDDVLTADDGPEFSLIVSQYDPEIDLSPAQISSRVGIKLAGTVPPSWVELANSHNTGTPVVLSAKRTPYVRAVKKLADDLLHGMVPDTPSVLTRTLNLLRPPQRSKRSVA